MRKTGICLLIFFGFWATRTSADSVRQIPLNKALLSGRERRQFEIEEAFAFACANNFMVELISTRLLRDVLNVLWFTSDDSSTWIKAVSNPPGSARHGISGGLARKIVEDTLKPVSGFDWKYVREYLLSVLNFREKMTMVYNAMTGSGFQISNALGKILKNYSQDSEAKWIRESTIVEISKLHEQDRVECNSLDRFRHEDNFLRGKRPCFIALFVPHTDSAVRKCRCMEGQINPCRIRVLDSRYWSTYQSPLDVKFPHLSFRELASANEDLEQTNFLHKEEKKQLLKMKELSYETIRARFPKIEKLRLPWIPGGNIYRVPNENETLNQYFLMSNNPSVLRISGPSSTSDMFLRLGTYLGFMKDDMRILQLACIGYMVPMGDHSLQEILAASESYFVDLRFKRDRSIFLKPLDGLDESLVSHILKDFLFHLGFRSIHFSTSQKSLLQDIASVDRIYHDPSSCL